MDTIDTLSDEDSFDSLSEISDDEFKDAKLFTPVNKLYEHYRKPIYEEKDRLLNIVEDEETDTLDPLTVEDIMEENSDPNLSGKVRTIIDCLKSLMSFQANPIEILAPADAENAAKIISFMEKYDFTDGDCRVGAIGTNIEEIVKGLYTEGFEPLISIPTTEKELIDARNAVQSHNIDVALEGRSEEYDVATNIGKYKEISQINSYFKLYDMHLAVMVSVVMSHIIGMLSTIDRMRMRRLAIEGPPPPRP